MRLLTAKAAICCCSAALAMFRRVATVVNRRNVWRSKREVMRPVSCRLGYGLRPHVTIVARDGCRSRSRARETLDHFALSQILQFGLRYPQQPPIDFVVVLPQGRTAPAYFTGCRTQPWEHTLHLDRAEQRIANVNERRALGEMRVGQH